MAELLIRAIDNTHKTSRPGMLWKNGDVVYAAPDGHEWSRMESWETWRAEGRDPALWVPQFTILRLTGLTIGEAQIYLAERQSLIDIPDPDFPGEFQTIIDETKERLRRNITCDWLSTEQRAISTDPETGLRRDTIRAYNYGTRNYTDADVQAAFTVKPAGATPRGG